MGWEQRCILHDLQNLPEALFCLVGDMCMSAQVEVCVRVWVGECMCVCMRACVCVEGRNLWTRSH